MTDLANSRTQLARALSTLGYEVLPFKGTFENVLENVPKDIRLTVTASPQKGIDATVDLATKLSYAGYKVAPHLSARMIAHKAQLEDIAFRLNAAGVTSLFVVGGDGEPSGQYTHALELLTDLNAMGFTFEDVGIGGYPEGHASISREHLDLALRTKAPMAHHITTQMCFAPQRIRKWADDLRAQGVDIPIRVGVPGQVSRQKLIRISAAIGLGDSARFLTKQQNLLWRFFMPGGYSPTKLVKSLVPDTAGASLIDGFHVFTFNDLKHTETWRQQALRRWT